MGAWYIRVTGKRRKDVNIDLLVQAVIALGEQLREEYRQRQSEPRGEQSPPLADTPEEDES